MAAMKRRTMIAVTVGVWLAAIGTATAVTIDLNRPVHPKSSASQHAAPAAPAAAEKGTGDTLCIPAVTIVGQPEKP